VRRQQRMRIAGVKGSRSAIVARRTIREPLAPGYFLVTIATRLLW
jgi:hypothetical protein